MSGLPSPTGLSQTTGLSIGQGLGLGYGLAFQGFTSFSPASLFAAGEQGVWYDPSDFTTMFQDSAGTTPVTAVEQPVGLLLDKSQGLVLGPELVTNGDFSSPSGWTLGTGAAIAGGVLSYSGGTSGNTTQPTVNQSGKTYIVTFTVVSRSAGSVRVRFAANAEGALQTAAGTYTLYTKSLSNNSDIIVETNGAFVGSIDNISVKELPGNHATQPTTTPPSRPVLSARVNLLTKTEQFDDAVWTKTSTTVTANAAVAPDGTTTADAATPNTTGFSVIQGTLVSGTYTASVSVKDNGAGSCQVSMGTNTIGYLINLNLSTGAFISGRSYGGGSLVGYTIQTQGNGWWRITVTATAGAGGVVVAAADGTSPTSGVFVWGADLRVTNDGVGIPAYQRVNTSTDYDTAGFPYYLFFDGSNDSMATSAIDFTATDKMGVFTGVRKLSDASIGVFAELSTIVTNAGTFSVYAPNTSGTYASLLNGSALGANNYATFTAPITNVLTNLYDIAQPTIATEISFRANGVVVSGSSFGAADAGTGNFGNYPLYIGRRGGSSLPFSGRLYSLIVRGAQSTETQIEQTEQWISGKMGGGYYPTGYDFLVDANGDQITDASGNPLYTQALYS